MHSAIYLDLLGREATESLKSHDKATTQTVHFQCISSHLKKEKRFLGSIHIIHSYTKRN